MGRKYNKYKNTKVVVNGITFDSKKEANRYKELIMLQRAGVITDLELQRNFELIPKQCEPDTIGKRGGVHKGKIIERNCVYRADFCYKKNGQLIVEDTKGMRTPDYIIKRKLMLFIHGIRIHEIRG